MNHFERKLMTILGHRIGWRKQTDMKRLQLITGKSEGEILGTLQSLEKKGYVEWDGVNMESIQLKKEMPRPDRPGQGHTIRYPF